MHKQIKEKISAIKDEVNELHPLLEAVFLKLPTVLKVDYTQGPRERGADFVIARKDPTFGDTEYVGVIAKIGQIKQKNSEVERQIDECELDRLTPEGKKIIISEIWIVATGSITQNAREVIHHKYKSKKIKWVDIQQLASWVEQYVPNYWANIPLEIGEYLHTLKQKNIEIDTRTSLVPESALSFYVEQLLEKIESDEYYRKKHKKNRPSKESLLNILNKERFIAIEGPMGAGKSKLLREVSTHYADPEIYANEKIIPVHITFKDLQDHYEGSAISAANSILESHGLSEETHEKLLIMIDALDEFRQSNAERKESLNILLGESEQYQNIKIILTSRRILDADLQETLARRASRYTLAPLTITQISKFVETLCTKVNVKSRILEDLKRSSLFKLLPKTPIAAIILGKLLQENIQDLPANMTELYSKYVELSLGRWDASKGLQSQKEFEALHKITARLAEYMLKNEIYSLAITEAEYIAKQYLSERNLGIETETIFDMLLNRSDILFADPEKQTITFKHKTFLEYFHAYRMLESDKVNIDESIYNPYWLNTYFFYVGLKRDCPELLNQILSIEPDDDAGRIIRLMNLGNFLLAGYLSPYKPIKEGIYRIFVDAAKLFQQVLNNNEHPLAQFSQMQLLAIFRSLLIDSYGYDFFKDAIEEALLRVDEEITDETEKVLSLFFLELLNAEFGGNELFENLIDKANGSLPLPIQLAIKHEADYRKNKSSLIKRLEKRLKKSLQSTSGMQKLGIENKLDEIYKRPIRNLK